MTEKVDPKKFRIGQYIASVLSIVLSLIHLIARIGKPTLAVVIYVFNMVLQLAIAAVTIYLINATKGDKGYVAVLTTSQFGLLIIYLVIFFISLWLFTLRSKTKKTVQDSARAFGSIVTIFGSIAVLLVLVFSEDKSDSTQKTG